jgi:4-hydroxybenzoate polyprenyltransferase
MHPLALIRALRPQQWVKNVFVLAALFFSWGEKKSIVLGEPLTRTLLALAAFCLGASAVYLVNDVLDIESDRRHPEKCKRPIAAGEVGVGRALAAAALCVSVSFALAWRAGGGGFGVLAIVATYVLLNFLYSLKLKHVVLVDVFSIASGFVLRVLGGARAADVFVSHWLLLCTIFLSLFLALCKRQAEINLLGEDRGSHRKILLEYSPAFLDQAVTIVAACTIVCYTMYTVAADTVEKFGSDRLLWTIPFVAFGLFRYLLLVQTKGGGGSPTKVLLGGDTTFVLNCFAWLALVSAIVFRWI